MIYRRFLHGNSGFYGNVKCICRRFNLIPEECLFTDDMPANIKAAEECGLQAVLFEGYEKTYPKIMGML